MSDVDKPLWEKYLCDNSISGMYKKYLEKTQALEKRAAKAEKAEARVKELEARIKELEEENQHLNNILTENGE